MNSLQDCDHCGEPEVLVKISAKLNTTDSSAVCRTCYQRHICPSCLHFYVDHLSGSHCTNCDEGFLCSSCNGSGEGYAPDSSCSSCGGSGLENARRRKQEEAEMRADYLYDQMKDER